MAKVFLSYRREDTEQIAGRIYDRLKTQFGDDNVFYDVETIAGGTAFRARISESIRQSHVLLVLIGEGWLGKRGQDPARIFDSRDFVRLEIETALNQGIEVIPILIGQAPMPDQKAVPASLGPLLTLNAIRVDPGRDFDHHIRGVLYRIDAIGAQRARFVGSAGTFQGSRQVNRPALFVLKTNKGYQISWLRGGMGIVVQRSMEERHDARWETVYEGPSDEYCDGSMLGIHDSRRWPIYWYRAKATGIPGQSIDSAWCDPVKGKPAGG